MVARLASLIVLFALLVSGAHKKTTSTARGENEDLILSVTIYIDGAAVKEALGDDLGGHYIVAKVTVEPKYTKEITIDRDDFVLRTDKDGEHTQSMVASQIAGTGGLVVTGTKTSAKRTGFSMGGPFGMGTPGIGNSSGPTGVKAEVDNGQGQAEDPRKKMLDEKILPEKKIDAPVTGFLYFPMENQKLKDLQLDFGGRENRIRIRFK
jgi:hypothetical protein